MDLIKEAFKNVKEDMDFLFQELQEIKRTLSEITTQLAKDSPDCVNPCRALILTFATILSHTFHEAASTRLNYGANVL